MLGAAAGGAIGFAETRIDGWAMLDPEQRMILKHIVVWSILGVGVGLGASLASKCRRTMARGTLAAFAGGLIGGALYIPVLALAIPDVDATKLVPGPLSALMIWIALPALCMALGLGRALSHAPAA